MKNFLIVVETPCIDIIPHYMSFQKVLTRTNRYKQKLMKHNGHSVMEDIGDLDLQWVIKITSLKDIIEAMDGEDDDVLSYNWKYQEKEVKFIMHDKYDYDLRKDCSEIKEDCWE